MTNLSKWSPQRSSGVVSFFLTLLFSHLLRSVKAVAGLGLEGGFIIHS